MTMLHQYSVYVLNGGIEKLFEVGAAPGDYAIGKLISYKNSI